MSWSDQPTSEQKTLRAIGNRLEDAPTDQTENLVYLNKSVKFLSSMVDVMQNGVDDANKDILLKIQDAIEDLLIIFGLSDSGDTLNFEWGELAMLLKNFTSIFSLQRLISGDWSQLPFNVQLDWIKSIWDNVFGKLSIENLLGLGKDNLIAIGHFDTRSQVPSVPGWAFDPVAGHTTAGSAKVTANGTDQFLPLTYIPAKAGDKFPVEGWVMRSSVTGSGQAQIRAQAFAEGSAQIGSDVVVASVAAAGTASWVKISGTFTAPAGTKSVRFGPAINDQVMTGDLRFDDIFATKPKGFLDASWILGLITSVFDMSWLSEISISQLGPAGSQNLLEGTFDTESSIDLSSSEGWEHDPTTGRTKPGSAKATANGTRRELRTKAFKTSPGTKLDLSGWVSWAGLTSSGGPAFTLALVTQLNNADVAVVPMGSVTPGAASGSWTQMTAGTFTVPSGVDSVRVMITMNQNVTAGTANFDDINLTRQGSLPQQWIENLIPDLGNLGQGVTDAWNFVQSTIDNFMNGRGILGSLFSLSHFQDEVAKVFGPGSTIPGNAIGDLGGLLGLLLPKSDHQALLNRLGGGSGTVVGQLPVLEDIIGAVTDGAQGGNLTSGNPLTDLWNNMFGLHQAAQSALTSAAAANTQLASQQQNAESGDAGYSYATTFGGANEAALGTAWSSSDVVIKNGYAGLKSSVTTNGSNYLAKTSNTASRDDMVVAVVLGDQGDAANTRIITRADTGFTTGVYVNVNRSGLAIGKWGSSGASLTQWAAVSVNISGGAAIRVRAVGNQYTVMLNGVDVLSATDTGTTAPIGAAYRSAGFTLGTDTGFFGFRYYSFRIASFMLADYNPPGASTMDSWRLSRASAAVVAMTIGNGSSVALPTGFLTTQDFVTGATVSNLGRGEVTIAKSGHYWLSFGAMARDTYSDGSSSYTVTREPFWSVRVDGAAKTGPVVIGAPIAVYLTAGQVVAPVVTMMRDGFSVGTEIVDTLTGPAHFSGVYMGG